MSQPTEPSGPTTEVPTLIQTPAAATAQQPVEAPTLGLLPGAPVTEQLVGERFGDFVLLNELGRGGMGIVYKAFEPGLGRHVAIKMILAGAVCSPADLERFRTEASAAARLQHPHIVKVHRVGVEDERHYYSMDYIAGCTLAQRIADGPLPGRVAARYLLLISEAIHHAHELGILHRDLKPGNILIDADDEPHVTDFGLAKNLAADHGQTRTGALLGTPSYMAPEQARGDKELTPATDVYGLGALLYELVTARPPFRGETPLDTVMQVLESDPAPPRLLNPKIDRDLETICLKCLAKDPRDRYASAQAVAGDLQRYLDGDSIQARSLNMLDYLSRTLERSGFDIELRPYGNLMLTFAAIVACTHTLKHFLMSTQQPYWLIATVRIGQFVLLGVALWLQRPKGKGLMPGTAAERLLWSVWAGYIVACFLATEATRQLFGIEAVYRGKFYPFYALFTGLSFFALGANYWGRLYAFGAAFFGLALLMLIDLHWATLEFGAAWTVTLCLIGLHLRRLGQDKDERERIEQAE